MVYLLHRDLQNQMDYPGLAFWRCMIASTTRTHDQPSWKNPVCLAAAGFLPVN